MKRVALWKTQRTRRRCESKHAGDAIEIRIERATCDRLWPPWIIEHEIVGTNVNARIDERSTAEPTRGNDAQSGEKADVVETGVGRFSPEQARDVSRVARKIAIAKISAALEH